MIQRIQSLYLLLITALLIAVLFLPFGVFSTSNEMYEYTAFSIKQIGAGGLLALPVWILAVLSGLSAVLAFGTIFLYKKRAVQKRICRYIALMLAVFCLVFGGFLLLADRKLNAGFEFGTGLALPLIALILDLLTIRAIGKDDALVKSWDRIR